MYVPSMPDILISQSGIQQLLKRLMNTKLVDQTISSYILKHCADEITPILYVIFNQFLSTCSLPNDWLKDICLVMKRVITVMLLTIDLRISLTSICAKIMEHIYISFNYGPPKSM